MSQKRTKKQLSTMDNVGSLTDQELREALKEYGEAPGPITESTRNLYRKKLASLIDKVEVGFPTTSSPRRSPAPRYNSSIPPIDELDGDSDTSDEDFRVSEEESEDDEDSESELSESDENEEVDDDLIQELRDADDLKSSTRGAESQYLTDITLNGPETAPNRISHGLLTLLLSFFAIIFSFYLYSSDDTSLFAPPNPLKSITKKFLVFLCLSPFWYVIYKSFRFYQARRHQENQRICGLVDEALELLQSPDNPKGMMPILHIRDTLLTPAERKNKKTITLWSKAVKFVEEHESRVKVEIVNIDGEDFRAWKWISARKL